MFSIIQMKQKRNTRLITEGAETRNMSAAKHYLYDKRKCDEQEAMRIIGSIKSDIPNVRLQKCKFILGVTRMFIERQLTDADVIMNLNKTLKFVASNAHVNEYDQNLNGLSVEDLITRFKRAEQKDLEVNKDLLSKIEFSENNEYTIVHIDDFEEAEEYGEYTGWCVVHYEEMYDKYTMHGINRFYFCLKNGYETLEEKKGPGCPLDEYGLSMIAVSVNEYGGLNTVTCRWNHENKGNDNIMTEEQLSKIIGRNFYDVFLPWSDEEITEKKSKVIKIFCNEVSEFSEDEFNDLFDSKYCEVLIAQTYNEYMDDSENDEDYYSYDKINFIYDNASGYIISSDYDDVLSDILGDSKWIVMNSDFYPVIDEIYDDARSSHIIDNPDEIYVTVRKNKSFNVLNFHRGEYVFNDWKMNRPNIIYGFNDSLYFLVDGKRIYSTDGKALTPECDKIDIFSRTATAFITIGNVTKYMNWLTGETYIPNIRKYHHVSTIYAIENTSGEIYLYAPDHNLEYGKLSSDMWNTRLRKVSNIMLKDWASMQGYRSIPGEHNKYGYAIFCKGYRGLCVVDTEKGITYDESGAVIDMIDE